MPSHHDVQLFAARLKTIQTQHAEELRKTVATAHAEAANRTRELVESLRAADAEKTKQLVAKAKMIYPRVPTVSHPLDEFATSPEIETFLDRFGNILHFAARQRQAWLLW